MNKTLLAFAGGTIAIVIARSNRVRAAAHCLRGRPTMYRMELAGPLTSVSPGSQITESKFDLPPIASSRLRLREDTSGLGVTGNRVWPSVVGVGVRIPRAAEG